MFAVQSIEVVLIENASNVSPILPGGQATVCSFLLYMCRNFDVFSQTVVQPEGEIDPNTVKIGICRVTGVACLKAAESFIKINGNRLHK